MARVFGANIVGAMGAAVLTLAAIKIRLGRVGRGNLGRIAGRAARNEG